MVISLYLIAFLLLLKVITIFFVVNDNSYVNLITSVIKTSNSMDLTGYGTLTSATDSNDKYFTENNRKVGDIKKGTGGKGKTKIVGGTGKYAGITGECSYTVSYHTEDKMSSILDCSYTK